jgi:PhnB protein
MRVNPYLLFNGDCEAAFKLYERVLGGKITAMFRFEGSPMAGKMPPEWQNKIMHASLTIGDEVLMGSDPPPDHQEKMKGFSVSLGIKEPAEADRVFHALAEGGTVTMPIGPTFWALRFGMLVDRFGTPWMINCEKPA